MQANINQETLQKLSLPNNSNVYELSKHGKVLLIFLRIFACPYCRKAINDVNEIVQSLRQLRVSVVFVHQGPENMARDVFEKHGPKLVNARNAAGHPDKFPYYEIVDEKREFYDLFNLPLFDWNNFERKEKPTWNRAIDRWGTCEWVGEVKQLGALFVIDKGGQVFSSMLQKGQTNIHDLAEFLNIPMDVRFLPDHTKAITYHKVQSTGVMDSKKEESSTIEKSSSQKSNTNTLQRQSSSIQIKEKYKEYRNFCLEALEEQTQYARTKLRRQFSRDMREENDEENEANNQKESQVNVNNNNNNNNEKSKNNSTQDLPQRIIQSSRLAQFLKCLPKAAERPYTEEEIREVVKNFNLNQVLDDQEIRRFFRVFLTKDLSVENILFYEATEDLLETIEKVKRKSSSSTIMVDKSDADHIALSVKTLIDEFLSSSSDNMVNVESSFKTKFDEFTQSDRVNQDLEQLEKHVNQVRDEVRFNMTDPLHRFRWSIEGQRAAAYVLVQE